MTQFSRSKKYKELHDQLQSDSEAQIQSTQLSDYANRLNQIDPNTFEKMDVKKEEYQATRVKEPVSATQTASTQSSDYQFDGVTTSTQSQYEKEEAEKIEKKLNDYIKENSNAAATFNNEYLDEFINEVKSYNIEKGLRTTEDTQMNILNELRSANTVRVFGENVDTPPQKTTTTNTIASPFNEAPHTSQVHANNIEETKKSITSELQKIMQSEATYQDDLSQLTDELNAWESQNVVAEEMEGNLEQQKESILESFLSANQPVEPAVMPQQTVAPQQEFQQSSVQEAVVSEPVESQQPAYTTISYEDFLTPAQAEEITQQNQEENTVKEEFDYADFVIPVEEPVIEQKLQGPQQSEYSVPQQEEPVVQQFSNAASVQTDDFGYDDLDDDMIESAFIPQEPKFRDRQEQLSATTSFKKHDDMEYLAAMEEDRIKRQSYFEETAQIKTQMTEYEDELDMVNKKVSNVNKLLNFFLVVLILALLVIIGFAVYTLLNAS